jgi:hypothetical protein
MASRETALPSIPDISTVKNVDPTLLSFLNAIKERVEIREGRAQDLDRAVTRRDLSRIGINLGSLKDDYPSYDFAGLLFPVHSRKHYFFPEKYGGVQGAIDEARNCGGGVVWLDSNHYDHDGLFLYDGVRLMGNADSFNGTGGMGTGTVLHNNGSGPAITIEGATGYGFEIAYMHLLGDGSTDDGIYLKTSGGSVPRSSQIHDLSIFGVGRDALRLDGFSYLVLKRLNLLGNNCTSQNGITIISDEELVLREFLFCEEVVANDFNSNGLNVVGQLIVGDFRKCNFGANNKGVYINPGSGAAFFLMFDHLHASVCREYGIEIYAENQHLGRYGLRNFYCQMKGFDSGEKAIYMHRAGNYTISNFAFDFIELNKAGAVAPKYAIDIGNGCIYGGLENVRNATGGGVNMPETVAIKYLKDVAGGYIEFPDGETTPDISEGSLFITHNTKRTVITDFKGGYIGKPIRILILDMNTIFDFTTSNLKGNQGADWSPLIYDWLDAVRIDNTWLCACHDCTA